MDIMSNADVNGSNEKNAMDTSSKPRQRMTRQREIEFLKNFNPEQSEREKRKLNRRLAQGNKKHILYDDKGIFIETGDNMCDCLDLECSGCHFPCPKCSSRKCGHDCRNNRKWAYESIEIEGSDNIIKNPVLKDA